MSGPLLVLTTAPLVLAIEDAKDDASNRHFVRSRTSVEVRAAVEMPAERAVSLCTPCLRLG